MKIYLVGGAVRDKLLNYPSKERDWVVVGATPEALLALGYQPVGKDFPVFLHPKTNEEYALARTERKIALGYKGFTCHADPNVTLEEDLERRDLTINAMAMDDAGTIIDPYHGQKDLAAKILRHVSPAFSEDPVRILRIARFYARYAHLGFIIAPETIALMADMVKKGEVNALVPERIWKEFERALGEKNPTRFFEALKACDAEPILFPELIAHPEALSALENAAPLTTETHLRLAALLHPLTQDELKTLSKRYRLPKEIETFIQLIIRYQQDCLHADQLTIPQLVNLLYALDAFRREPRFRSLLVALQQIGSFQQRSETNHALDRLRIAAEVAKSVSIQPLLDEGLTGESLASAIRLLREKAIEKSPRFSNDGNL